MRSKKICGPLVAAALGLAFIAPASADTYSDLKACISGNQTSRAEILKKANDLRLCINTIESGKGLTDPGSSESSKYHALIKEQDAKEAAEMKANSKNNDLNAALKRCQGNKQYWDSVLNEFRNTWKSWGCDDPQATKKARQAKLDALKAGTANNAQAETEAKAKADAAAKAKAAADAAAKAKAEADAAAAKAKAEAEAKAKEAAAKTTTTSGSTGGGSTSGLKKCADDGGTCTVTGAWTGKYGNSTKMVDMKGTGTFRCLPKGWAKPWEAVKVDTGVDDPTPGKAKSCYLN